MTGKTQPEAGTRDNIHRFACTMMLAGGDAIYCSGGLDTVQALAREHIPVVGHVGLVPSRARWTGGFRAVAKTADAAMALWAEVQAYEAAGAFALEIEVVPDAAATASSAHRPVAVVDGGGCGLRRAISVRRRYPWPKPGPYAAPFQGLSQLCR